MVHFHHELVNTSTDKEYTERILNNTKLLSSGSKLNINHFDSITSEKYPKLESLKLLQKESI